MALTVSFRFRPGLRRSFYSNVQLNGWWDDAGRPAQTAKTVTMEMILDEAGASTYQADADLDAGSIGQSFRWSVTADGPGYDGKSMVLGDAADTLTFTLDAKQALQIHDLTFGTFLGANFIVRPDGAAAICFRVYAPNALNVELVLADPVRGYVADDGTGGLAPLSLAKERGGLWSIVSDSGTAAGGALDGTPYMYRVTKDDGTIAYRTDLFSRAQIGGGDCDPKGGHCNGPPEHLDGTKSCSVVRDPGFVRDDDGTRVTEANFWGDEFRRDKPLPTDTRDLVIYELHVGALGFGQAKAGTLDDAIAFVDHLVDLGINAVELLPIAEFQGDAGWGYSTSHFAAIEESAGGSDRLKHFVRACHRQGIAVILDVVYNHYDGDAERAEWMYDTNDHSKNFCYWYEGKPSDYRHDDGTMFPEGGYIDNQSTGYAPRYFDPIVRQLFISSAAGFVVDFHIDGFRVDQTTSIHSYAVFHADGRSAEAAKAGGVAFLRHWTQTLRLIKPGIFLMAEDHSGWDRVTMPYDQGGLGFDAAWYSDFYHNLIDFGDGGGAKLLRNAGYGDGRALHMSWFAGSLWASRFNKVVYNDSHDEAGNSKGSARTICLAVDNAPLIGDTRIWAESRVRVTAGLALLSAGTPMFFMGEEVGAQQPYRYDDFLSHREDIVGLKRGIGAHLFAYYKDLIALSRRSAAVRSRNIEILLADDDNRVIAFRCWEGADESVVVASLNNASFDNGFWIRHASLAGKHWRETFNSDAGAYGGANIGNGGATLPGDAFDPIVPAAGLLVFSRT